MLSARESTYSLRYEKQQTSRTTMRQTLRHSVAALLALFFTGASALYGPLTCNGSVRWQPWDAVIGKVSSGDVVEIPCGVGVELKKNLPPLAGLRVRGHLRVPTDDGAYTLIANWVLVEGKFEAGDPENHFDAGSSLSIGLTSGSNLYHTRDGKRRDFGTKVFAVVGGALEFYGVPGGAACENKTWAKLGATITPGSNNIIIDEDMTDCWTVNHQIAISPTGHYKEAEDRVIKAITLLGAEKTLIVVDRPFEYEHTGADKDFMASGKRVSPAGEISLLTRSVSVVGEAQKESELRWGHVIISETYTIQQVFGVEFSNLGNQGTLGQYPAHFHLCEDMTGSSFSSNTVRNTQNRGLVVHGTDSLSIENNVFYNVVGHGLVLEDGIEMNNIIRGNLGILNLPAERLIVKDGEKESDNNPSTFWLSNPNNTFENNIASGAAFAGIWYELKDRVTGPSKNRPGAYAIVPNKTNLGPFKDNEAHSNLINGLRVYPIGYHPAEQAEFATLTAWMNRVNVFFHRSSSMTLSNSTLFDGLERAMEFDVVTGCKLVDSVIVGRSPVAMTCPSNGAIGINGAGMMNELSGNAIERVKLDGFQNCRAPLIRNMFFTSGMNLRGAFPASTSISDVEGDSLPEILNFDVGYNSKDEHWRFAAVKIDGVSAIAKGQSGYLVTKRPLMLPGPGEASCQSVSSSTSFCPNSCYRSLKFSIMGRTGSLVGLKVTRLADNKIDYLPQTRLVSRTNFFLNIRAGHEYAFDILWPRGVSPASDYHLQYQDGEDACEGKVVVYIKQYKKPFHVSMDSMEVTEKPCDETKLVAGKPYAYGRCLQGVYYQGLELPGGVMEDSLFLRHSNMDNYFASNICSTQQTKCVAVGKEESWKYADSGFTSSSAKYAIESNIRSMSFNDSTWKTGYGNFGFGNYPGPIRTPLQGPHVAYYFRKTFTISRSSCVRSFRGALNVRYGDGFIVYVNGVEVYRKNMPNGGVNSQTRATANGVAMKYTPFSLPVMSMLQSGQNLVSVSLHRYEKATWHHKNVMLDVELKLGWDASCL